MKNIEISTRGPRKLVCVFQVDIRACLSQQSHFTFVIIREVAIWAVQDRLNDSSLVSLCIC